MLEVHLESTVQSLNGKSCLLTGLSTLDILSERLFLCKLTTEQGKSGRSTSI